MIIIQGFTGKLFLKMYIMNIAKTRNASGFLMLVGVDNFKEINEKYGAKTGDEVLEYSY